MRLLVDEDLASRTLLATLAGLPGLELLPTIRELSDDDVWNRAQQEAAVLLTGNAKDFVPRARVERHHAGLLLVVRQNTPRDLGGLAIGRAVQRIGEQYPSGFRGITLVVNAFVR